VPGIDPEPAAHVSAAAHDQAAPRAACANGGLTEKYLLRQASTGTCHRVF